MEKNENIEFWAQIGIDKVGTIVKDKFFNEFAERIDIKLNKFESDLFRKYGFEHEVKDGYKVIEYIKLKGFIKDTIKFCDFGKGKNLIMYMESIIDDEVKEIRGFEEDREEYISRSIVIKNKGKEGIERWGGFKSKYLENEILKELFNNNDDVKYLGEIIINIAIDTKECY